MAVTATSMVTLQGQFDMHEDVFAAADGTVAIEFDLGGLTIELDLPALQHLASRCTTALKRAEDLRG